MNYTQLSSQETISSVMKALEVNNITSEEVSTASEAKARIASLIPQGAQVLTMTSITLEQSGINDLIDNSGQYKSVRTELTKMDRQTQSSEMQKLGAAPDWSVGSVHAITEDGKVVIASNGGSQLPGYVYGSPHVIWVVSTKKIVKNLDDAFNRIQEHIVPLESARARQAYGLPDTFHTFASKILIVNRETSPKRIHVIFVKEDLGF